MVAAEAAATSGEAASAKARPQGAALNRYPVPDWVLACPCAFQGCPAKRRVPACPCAFQGCPAKRRVHQQVYLHPYPKELMLRNHV